MKRKCKCPKLTRVHTDGYQYCADCGKAHAPPPIKRGEEGEHEVVDVGHGDILSQGFHSREWKHQTVRQQQCKHCGVRFNFNETTGQYQGPRPTHSKCLPLGQIALKGRLI